MNTTISIPAEMREQLKEFGKKGEKYSDIISRLLNSARDRQIHDILMDDTDTIPVREALRKARKKWQ